MMNIYRSIVKPLIQVFAATLLSSVAITEAIAQSENHFHISELAKVKNCEFLPSLTYWGADEIYFIYSYVPETDQEFREFQLYLEQVYLCKSALQREGLLDSLDEAILSKLNVLDSISQEFILFAADPEFTILDPYSQLITGLIPFYSYDRFRLSEINNKAVKRFRDEVGLPLPKGFFFIKAFYRDGEYLDAPRQIHYYLPRPEYKGVTIGERYIIISFEDETDNLRRAGRLDQINKTFSHELIHAYVNSSTTPEIRDKLPKWFHEGVAIHFSGSGGDSILMDSHRNIEGFSDPDDYESWRLAFKYIEHRIGSEQFNRLIKYAIETGNSDVLLESVGATSFHELDNMTKQWNLMWITVRQVLIGLPIACFLLWLILPRKSLRLIKEQLHLHGSH